MEKLTISHVSIKVSSMEKSAPFYDKLCYTLGLKQIRRTESSLAYGNDSFSIWLHQVPKKSEDALEKTGYHHVAFRTQSKELVDELQSMLKKENFKILYPAAERLEFAPGWYSIAFPDPDGTILELLYLPESKTAYG